LRKDRILGGIVITLSSWFSFVLMKISRNWIEKVRFILKESSDCPFIINQQIILLKWKNVAKLTHYKVMLSPRWFLIIRISILIFSACLPKFPTWITISFSKFKKGKIINLKLVSVETTLMYAITLVYLQAISFHQIPGPKTSISKWHKAKGDGMKKYSTNEEL